MHKSLAARGTTPAPSQEPRTCLGKNAHAKCPERLNAGERRFASTPHLVTTLSLPATEQIFVRSFTSAPCHEQPCVMGLRRREGRKIFFFEKKKQKTFVF
jgi:hypothetical protein